MSVISINGRSGKDGNTSVLPSRDRGWVDIGDVEKDDEGIARAAALGKSMRVMIA